MNIPNLLTIARIFLVPLLVAALVQDPTTYSLAPLGIPLEIGNSMVALTIFLVAALTDLLDGYLARKWSQVTTLGMLLDPVADKLLISSALIALVEVRMVPGWMVILIVAREFAISGLRSIASTEGYVIPASDLGKSKMVLQVLGVSLSMVAMRQTEWRSIASVAMFTALLFTLASAVDYLRQFWRRVDDSVKRRRRRELLLLERNRRRAARGVTRDTASG